MKFLIIIAIIGSFLLLLRVFRKPIVRGLLILKAKLNIRSLRGAIQEADDNKERTDRKTMVVFNMSSGEWETVEKKVLKKASSMNRNTNNAKMTDGRRRFMKKKNRAFDNDRVKAIEKKSLYVTR